MSKAKFLGGGEIFRRISDGEMRAENKDIVRVEEDN